LSIGEQRLDQLREQPESLDHHGLGRQLEQVRREMVDLPAPVPPPNQ
jgi:hypothetical protein